MHAGIVQQFGTPEEVYDRPANLFVAGFIGSPPMNFIDGEIDHRRRRSFDPGGGAGVGGRRIGPRVRHRPRGASRGSSAGRSTRRGRGRVGAGRGDAGPARSVPRNSSISTSGAVRQGDRGGQGRVAGRAGRARPGVVRPGEASPLRTRRPGGTSPWARRAPDAHATKKSSSNAASTSSGRSSGEVVTAVESTAAHVAGPVAPDREHVVPLFHRTVVAPEREQWTRDRAHGAVGIVVRAIDRRTGPVVLADRVDRFRIVEAAAGNPSSASGGEESGALRLARGVPPASRTSGSAPISRSGRSNGWAMKNQWK